MLVNEAKLLASQTSFHTSFMKELTAVEDPLRELAMEMPSTTKTESHNWIAGVPGLSEWKDQRKLSRLRAEAITITNRNWASGIQIDRDDILDDKLGIVNVNLAQLARKAALSYGDLVVEALLAGFSATSEFGKSYDGVAFFSASHKETPDVATQSNTGTAALDREAYISARAQMRGLVDEQGHSVGVLGNVLIVGPANEQLALELTAPFIFHATEDGAAAVPNVNASQITRIIVSDKLVGDYANYWFLADLRQAARPLILQIREPITTAALPADGSTGNFSGSELMFMSKKMLFGAQARHNVGYGPWQFIFGSTGAS